MRSKELVDFQQKLSEYNTHYSHFLFTSKQFRKDNEQKLTKNKDKYTGDVFDKEFSRQFNVKLSDFSSEFNKTVKFFQKSIFLLSYFQFEIYVKSLYDFGKNYRIDIPDLKSKTSPITQLVNNFSLSSEFISKDELDTLEYFRLRRNATVHRATGKAYQGDYADFIKQNGKRLDKYWEQYNLEIRKLSFQKKNIEAEEFNEEELFDAINIIRRIAENIDLHFVSNIIGRNNLLNLIKKKVGENKLAKFSHLCIIEYGITITEEEGKNYLGM